MLNRRIGAFPSALIVASLFAAGLLACGPSGGDRVIEPPSSHPLSERTLWGVVGASYAPVLDAPRPDGLVLGHRRRGDIVEIGRRISVGDGDAGSSRWVFLDAENGGWMREEDLSVYDSEGKARTAATGDSR